MTETSKADEREKAEALGNGMEANYSINCSTQALRCSSRKQYPHGKKLQCCKVQKLMVLTIFATCFGSSFLIGYNMAVLNLPVDFVKMFLDKTINGPNSSSTMSEKRQDPTFLYATVNALTVLAGAIGASVSGLLLDNLGRRNTLLFNHIFSISGGIICSLCVHFNRPSLLYIGRFLAGINIGISMGSAPLYLTEIAATEDRGAIGSFHQLAITIGILMGYLVSIPLSTVDLWPIACGIGLVGALFSLFTLRLCPDSPLYLYAKKSDEIAAHKAYTQLNGNAELNKFSDIMKREMSLVQAAKDFRFFNLFTQKQYRLPLMLTCGMQVVQQFSGINAVISYSSTMLKTAGIASEHIKYFVIGIGLFNVLVTVVAVLLVERLGRRSLVLWPTLVMAISLLGLTITVNLSSTLSDTTAQRATAITSAVLILIYIGGFAMGLGPITALFVAEVFSQGPRASAYSLTQCLQLACNLIVLLTYPPINEAIGGYSFLPYLVTVCGFWVFFFFYLPETLGRQFQQNAENLATWHTVFARPTTNAKQHGADVKADQYEGYTDVKPTAFRALLTPTNPTAETTNVKVPEQQKC